VTYSYDPLGRVPPESPPPQQPISEPPPTLEYPPNYQGPVNPFATLSLIFAFVFAPAGAILGHLGLAQIRRTAERGRNRALIGLTLSYAFIAVTVVWFAAWATLPATSPNQIATPPTTAETPQGPTVAPDAVAALLPGVADLKTITGNQNLKPGQKWSRPNLSGGDAAVDRPECWGSVAAGAPPAYDAGTISGYQAQEFNDTRSLLSSVRIVEAAAGFHDAPAAQAQMANLLAGWHQCGGRTVNVTVGGQTIPFTLGAPVDAGNGITTMDLTPKGLQVHSVRAIATKANIVIDLYVSYSGHSDNPVGGPGQSAKAIATYILNKVPG
jgi:hypothetical protein